MYLHENRFGAETEAWDRKAFTGSQFNYNLGNEIFKIFISFARSGNETKRGVEFQIWDVEHAMENSVESKKRKNVIWKKKHRNFSRIRVVRGNLMFTLYAQFSKNVIINNYYYYSNFYFFICVDSRNSIPRLVYYNERIRII